MTGPVENPGVNRRAIQELFCHCQERKEVEHTITASMMEVASSPLAMLGCQEAAAESWRKGPGASKTVTPSLCAVHQVYNEQIYDLLTGNRDKSLAIRSAGGRTYVDGALAVVVHTPAEMGAVMDRGQENRRVGATLMNTDSSRSHLLFCVRVEGVNKITKQAVRGALTLVDLAGSERVSKTEASGERLVEAAAINKSLSALGQVFKALATNAPHVPYRNSKLTHVLTDSLGGDSKTAVFVNVSPRESNMSETHMTLKFGQGIRKIELGPASKQLGPLGPPKPAMPGPRPVPK
jgi:kinesin family protein C2/C3